MSIAKSKVRSRKGNIALAEAIEPRRLLSTITVNSLSDAATQSAGEVTLRDALADAASAVSPAIIDFSPSLFASSGIRTISLSQGELTVPSNVGALTITGPGASLLAINGNGKSRVLEIDTPSAVTISGMTITNGSAAGGGGIEDVAGPLTLQSVVITKNTSTSATSQNAMGGGVLGDSSLDIENSSITSNSAIGGQGVKYGGVPTGYSADGGGVASEGTLTITGSVLSDNVAQGGDESSADGISGGGSAFGGALWAAAAVSISDSTISGNQATGGSATGQSVLRDPYSHSGSASGGAIFAPESTTVLLDSTISDNSAVGGSGVPFDENTSVSYGGDALGGGVYTGDGTLTITQSSVSSNSAIGGSNIGFSGVQGGGLCGGQTTVVNSNVNENSAIAGQDANLESNGGSIDAEGGGIVTYVELDLVQSSVSDNEVVATNGWAWSPSGSASRAGGIFDFGNLTLLQSTVSGNFAQAGSGYSASQGDPNPSASAGDGGDGTSGGLFCGGITCQITDSTIAENLVEAGDGGSNAIDNGPGGDGGTAGDGAIFADSGLTLLDSTVTGNAVVDGHGGSAGTGFTAGMSGKGYGGGMSAFSDSSYGTLSDNSIVSENTVDGAFNDILGNVASTSSNSLIGVGGGLVNGTNGNQVGVDDPQLSPLGNYGGSTETMVPLPGSPAIDTGSNSLIPSGLTVDQRGLPRISGASVDIGATEFTITSPSISGFVTSSGIGLSGVTVYLDSNNNGKLDPGEPSTTTYSSGEYIFEGLSDGAYIVRQLVPAGNHQITPNNNYGNHVTLTGLAALTNVNFSDALITGSISGVVETSSRVLNGAMVYLDANNNGVLDPGELSTITDSSGQYSFANLPPGQYIVRQVLPLGYSQTKPTNNFGDHVTLAGLQAVPNENFIDENGTGSVSGVVDSGDEPLAGVTVFLDANNDGQLDDGELDTVTNSAGQYTFNNVVPGKYIVRQILPAEDVQVTPGDNYGDHITVGPLAVITNQNFIDAPITGWISGTVTVGSTDLAGITVYLDANNNGKLDPGEMSTTTNSSGQYSFSGVPLGSYVIRQILPAGYVQISPTNNFGLHLTLVAAQSVINEDFSDSLVSSAGDDAIIDLPEIMPSDLTTLPT